MWQHNYEPLAGSLGLSALAAGVPAVVTAPVGEVTEPTEVDGVLSVPAGQLSALTDALSQVLSDRSVANRLTAAGRRRAARQSWDAIAAAHTEVYQCALAVRRGGESWTGTAEPSRVVPSTTVEGNADVTA